MATKRHIIFTLKLVLVLYLAYLIYFLATGYHPDSPAYRPPFALFVLDTINLFIHEAGHFFFKFLGMFIHLLAGSAFQVALPLALLIVTWRQNVSQIPLPAFWVGESLINVSVYIHDAPFKRLRLINPNLIHDWNRLLRNHLDWAETLGDIVFVVGLMTCIGAVVTGVVMAVVEWREPTQRTDYAK
ncbi:MAG: hypothetical protein EPO24_06970 [Bacteroidetes bacterium]|nr:MAG: hypothetical protein EPO24_06970 [Bacteroidota bacterium]